MILIPFEYLFELTPIITDAHTAFKRNGKLIDMRHRIGKFLRQRIGKLLFNFKDKFIMYLQKQRRIKLLFYDHTIYEVHGKFDQIGCTSLKNGIDPLAKIGSFLHTPAFS